MVLRDNQAIEGLKHSLGETVFVSESLELHSSHLMYIEMAINGIAS